MSKFLRIVGQVAGVVASVAVFIPGGQGVAAIAGAVSAVASTASALTVKRPASQGAVTDRLIGANNPSPYVMGRVYLGGVQCHDVAWGGKIDKVQNPYRFVVSGYSCCGPVDAVEALLVDRQAVSFSGAAATGYFAGFLYADRQLGARPESDALAAQWASPPNWASDYKLSGWAAVGWSLKFDKDGKVFTGNLPELGAVVRGVKVYDPRLDSTFPGGSGSCRVDDEATWVYSANPALHAGSYAFGRYVNGDLVFGVDLGDAVDFGAVAAWANLCDANGWTIGGVIFEPGDKWNNLKNIALAGGGEPVLAGGTITFRWHASRVALDTISGADLAEGPLESAANKSWATAINTARPKYMSEAHGWSQVQASAVNVSAFVTADAEEKVEELPFDLVTDKDQAAELALYEIWNRREAGPFVLTAGPRVAAYRPGDALTIDADCELWPTDQLAVVTRRSVDPATGFVELELMGETAAKHAAVLGATATAPAVPPLPAVGDVDEAAAVNADVTANSQVVIIPPPQVTIFRDYLGVPKSGEFDKVLTPVVQKGGVDKRTDNDFSYSASFSGVTASVNNTTGSSDKGRVTITAGGVGSVSLTVTHEGVAYGPFLTQVRVEDDPPPTTGTGGGTIKSRSDSTLADVTGTGFSAMTATNGGESVFLLDVASGESLYASAPLNYNWTVNSGSGTNELVAKWQYSSDNSSWTDFGSAITGSSAFWSAAVVDGEPGSIMVTQTKSGLAAGQWYVRLVGAKASGAGNGIYIFSGTAFVEART